MFVVFVMIELILKYFEYGVKFLVMVGLRDNFFKIVKKVDEWMCLLFF